MQVDDLDRIILFQQRVSFVHANFGLMIIVSVCFCYVGRNKAYGGRKNSIIGLDPNIVDTFNQSRSGIKKRLASMFLKQLPYFLTLLSNLRSGVVLGEMAEFEDMTKRLDLERVKYEVSSSAHVCVFYVCNFLSACFLFHRRWLLQEVVIRPKPSISAISVAKESWFRVSLTMFIYCTLFYHVVFVFCRRRG